MSRIVSTPSYHRGSVIAIIRMLVAAAQNRRYSERLPKVLVRL
jgi:hypothetical protein